MKKKIQRLAILISLSFPSIKASAEDVMMEKSSLDMSMIIEQKTAREFIAYKLTDLCKEYSGTTCVIRYNPEDLLRYTENKIEKGVEKEIVYFEGTAAQYLDYLNDKERYLNQLGASLRDQVDQFYFRKIPTDIAALRKALLQTLKIYAPELMSKLREPIPTDQCTQIPEFAAEELPKKIVELSDGKVLKVPELIREMNESQRVLCALGYDLFGEIDVSEVQRDVESFFSKSIDKRESLFDVLGLSKYMSIFNLENFEKIKSYAEIAQDIDNLIKAKQFPGPEQILDLKNKLNAQLPDNFQIPDVPNIPAATVPKRLDLNLIKSKKWTGFNFGKRDVVATGADASMELRGSKLEQSFTAEGKASLYILNNEINALSGYAQLNAAPTEISSKVKLQALGKDVFPPIEEKASVQLIKDVPDVFSWNFDKNYSTQFMIGPVPVDLRVGAIAKIGIGYSVAIATTRLSGAVYPKASAEGYAEGVAGFSGLLAVGAGARITLLDLRVPLTGSVGYESDEVGYPSLTLMLNAVANYEYLNGSIYAFAEYPVPAAKIPPWKAKRDNVDIFTFNGEKKNHKIMNYKIVMGRKGAKTSGDLLDQADQDESKKLADAILLDQRSQVLADFEQQVNLEVRNIFQGILNDLNGAGNQKAANQSEEVRVYREQFNVNLNDLGVNAAQAALR